MEINVDEENRLVNIWLTKAEKEDSNTLELLKPFYEEYHMQKYNVGVFLSGKGNLFENSRDFLLHNRYQSKVKNDEKLR